MATLRERFRAQMRDEIKQVALRQLEEGGPDRISINAIGKELGVSGPALYRYFGGRDALVTELVIDAYRDLAGALGAALTPTEPHGRLAALARAYRSWALAQPHRYRLLFTAPLPGYDAHAGELVEAAQEAMNVLVDALGEPASVPPDGALAEQLAAWASDRGVRAGEGTALRAVLAWSRLHGFVSLELAGNFASMGLDADRVFEVEVAALAA